MKKLLKQIALLVLVMSIGFASVLIPEALAADNISVSGNLEKNQNYTVTVTIPSNAVGYNGIIKVTYADKSTDQLQVTKLTGIEGSYAHPGNASATFKAKAAGAAKVELINFVVSDANGNSINDISKTKDITIKDVTPAPQPSQPAQPAQNTTPAQPAQNTAAPAQNTAAPAQNTTPANTTNTAGTQEVKQEFTAVNEKVFTTERCNVRESYSTKSNKLATVNKGTEFTRTGTSKEGWSKVTYNGKDAYISSQYLTTDEPKVEIKDVNKTMYSTKKINVRANYNTQSDVIGYLLEGDEAQVIGIAENGWTKIKYEGKDAFVYSSYLSDEKPEGTSSEDETPATDGVVTNEEQLKALKEKIGVIPEVGHNIADKLYLVAAATAFIACGVIVLKSNKE